MVDLFNELNSLINEINKEKEKYFLITTYYEEIINETHASSIEINHIDTYLDYMNYDEYIKIVSNALISCYKNIKIELQSIKDNLNNLEIKYKELINKIANLSKINPHELNLDGIDNLNFFLVLNNELSINPLLENISIELIQFVKFLINLRANNENLSINDSYALYNLEKFENTSCLNK